MFGVNAVNHETSQGTCDIYVAFTADMHYPFTLRDQPGEAFKTTDEILKCDHSNESF